MRTIVNLIAAAFVGCSLVLQTARAGSTEGEKMQTPKKFHFEKTAKADVQYLLFLPKDYSAKADQKWPLLMFLHGAGERGTDIWKVAVHGPPKCVPQQPDFPFILVSPQCPEGQTWSSEILLGLLDEVSHTYAVDATRVYLTGLSMGGYGTWDLALSNPERFAAIAPICGGGETIKPLLASPERARALKSLGVWAFHGGKDNVVPPEESERMVNFLKRIGVQEVKLTVYPEAGHDSWTETYNNPEFYQWLLNHRRSTLLPK